LYATIARGAVTIRYALNHWNGLEQFLANGRIELDTNSIERAMKPIILSRKNSLFAGSDEGGANWVRIPMKLAADSNRSRPPIPIEAGR
jgi:hypothetical protein